MIRLRLIFAFLCCFWPMVVVEAGPQVEGLLGVTWGMGAEKIEQVMRAQDFYEKTVIDQGNALRYRGTYHGYACYVNFTLRENKFCAGTISALAQVADPERNGEVSACFSVLAERMTAVYGEPTEKLAWQGSRTYFWHKLSGAVPQDEIDLMLSEHFAEGGLTEGSVEVRFLNRRLEDCLYYRVMGRPSAPLSWH